MAARRVLLDECVPRPLRRLVQAHDLRTVYFMGWDQLSNGKLVAKAEAAGFDVLLTADKNLSYQQNLGGRKIALVVLPTNRWPDLVANAPVIEEALTRVPTGGYLEVSFP